MSFITTLSVKEEHRSSYLSLRNYLRQRNQSIGDYLLEKWNSEFQDLIRKTLD